MSTIPLTPTSYVVLGCLQTAGPSTPYDLKQQVTDGIGYFWSFPHSQLYSEPARLAEAGLVKEEREDRGRRRRTFSITDRGRQALHAWVADPSGQLPDIRDVGLLKLFFAEEAGPEVVAALARSQRDAHRERLELYETLAADAAGAGPAAATLGLGLAWERSATAFWTEVADHPPGP